MNKHYNDVLKAVEVLVETFNITYKNAIDLIRVAIEKGQDMDTIKEYSPVFQRMGYSASETIVLINVAKNIYSKGFSEHPEQLLDEVKEIRQRYELQSMALNIENEHVMEIEMSEESFNSLLKEGLKTNG